jgi:hypothetical protein
MTSLQKPSALNVGCGPDYRTDLDDCVWTNIDNGRCRKDYHCDITDVPWRFVAEGHAFIPRELYDRIDAIQVLEHVPKDRFISVIRSMYAASKEWAEWNIASPHGFSDNFITDPTHQMPFSTRTFDYFVDGTALRELGIIYGWDDICLEYVEPPTVDGNQSVVFKLRVRKHATRN